MLGPSTASFRCGGRSLSTSGHARGPRQAPLQLRPDWILRGAGPGGNAGVNLKFYRRAALGMGFVLMLLCYFASVRRMQPSNFFGLTQDDTIYFSSAQALAAGHGYILPSVPGKPHATKYPILYPGILSWVWRWNPSFPSNLSDAAMVSAAFGACFLVLVFFFLRSLKG